MPDFEVAQALRTLERHDFEGVAIDSLFSCLSKIKNAIEKVQAKCDHNWYIKRSWETTPIEYVVYFHKLYECSRCRDQKEERS